jgi:hypothetical protein
MSSASRIAILGVVLASLTVPASATTIDFEAFVDGQNIEGMNLGGVTITNTSGNVEIYDDRFGVSYHSATKAIGSFTGAASNNPMIFTFDFAQSLVSLWGGDGGGDNDSWTLNAYDAAIGGNLIDTAMSGVFVGSPYRQLTVAAPGILRVEAIWTGPECCGIGYDDLEFESRVPEPTSVALLGLGLSCVALSARRRRSRRG